MNKQKFDEFEDIFHPKSIAVVGVTRGRESGASILFGNMLRSGFQGNVYPINPSGGEILGVKCYPRVSDIPEPVDYVLMAVSTKVIPGVIDDCTSKGVKTVSLFTAGYSEVGTSEGRRLEEELVQQARKSGIRVIGPNCLGIIYNSSIKLESVDLGLPYKRTSEVGPVGIIAQSGGVALRSSSMALARGIRLSKVVSYGNACDLDGMDFLEYFAEDPDTEIIGLYIEGIKKDGRRLFELLRQICQTKPVVILKGGRTEAGSEVAASHTGSLATSYSVWKAMSEQLGVTLVESQDEFVDTLLAFYCLGGFRGHNMGFIASFTDGGGGDSVGATDMFSSLGFKVPPFSDETRTLLQEKLPAAGTILRNPLDASPLSGDMKGLENIIGKLADDPRIDLVVIQQYFRELFGSRFKEAVQELNDIFIRLRNKQSKPVVVISPSGFPTSEDQWEIERNLVAARIPVYRNQETAAKAIARVREYSHFRKAI